jgi:hypothetical protein
MTDDDTRSHPSRRAPRPLARCVLYVVRSVGGTDEIASVPTQEARHS